MQVKRRERVAIQRNGAGCELHLQGRNTRAARIGDRVAGQDDRVGHGICGVDRHGRAGLRICGRTELAAGEEHRRGAALYVRLRNGGAAAGDRQETHLRTATLEQDGLVIVVGAVVVHAHGDDDLHEQVVELALEIAGEQALELREQHAAAAERVSGNDVEHLIEQCAALELVDAGLHPSGIIAVVLAGEVALIDPVGKVEQVLAVRDRDGGHVVNDLVDVRHDLRDRPGVIRQILAEEGLDEVARDRLEHIGREAEFPGILGQVIDHMRSTRGGICVMDGAGMRLVAHAHVGARLTADGAAAQVDKADRARIRQRRAGLDVIKGVAGLRGHGGDVDRVHMTGEDDAHAGIGILLRDALIAVDEVHGQDGGLDIEVRHQTVVLQTDDKVAACLGGGSLLDDPFFQIGADGARLMLIRAVGGVLLAVAAGVHGDNGQPLDRSRNIGQAAGLIARGRGEGRDDGRIGVDKIVDTLEVLRVRARGGHGLTVGGVEVLGIVIADVMVAVDDIDLQPRNILLQLLQLLCQRRVALLLAVLGQVAGHEKDVGLVRADLLKLFVQDCGALLEQLAVAVERMLKVLRACDHIRREIVQVGHDGDPQVHVLRLFRRKRRNRQCEDKDYRQQQRQQSASIVHSGFHFFLLFFRFLQHCTAPCRTTVFLPHRVKSAAALV